MVADDHSIVIEGIRRLLASEFEVVAEAADGRELLAAVREHAPDVVVTDIGMPLLNGIEATRRIRDFAPDVRIVVLTMYRETGYAAQCLQAGALGYVLKANATAELVPAVHAVLRGRRFISGVLDTDAILKVLSSRCAAALTDRQREVLELLAEGRTAKEIGRVLSVSPKTVEYHKNQLRQRLQVNSTAELVRFALSSRIVPH